MSKTDFDIQLPANKKKQPDNLTIDHFFRPVQCQNISVRVSVNRWRNP